MPNESRLVTIDPKQIADVQALCDNFSARKVNVALQSAISRTLTTGRALIARRVADTVNLKIADIKAQVAVTKPSFNRLVGALSMKRKPVPLVKYMSAGQIVRVKKLAEKRRKGGEKARFMPSGIAVRVRKNGAVEKFPTSFIANMKSGHVGIFRRRRAIGPATKNGGVPRVRRLPIDERYGPTVVGVLANAPGNGAQTILDEVVNELGAVLQKNVASQVSRLADNKGFEKFAPYTGE